MPKRIDVYGMDKDGHWLASDTDLDSVAVAKQRARRWLEDPELALAGLYKVEVHVDGKCVWDRFAKRTLELLNAMYRGTWIIKKKQGDRKSPYRVYHLPSLKVSVCVGLKDLDLVHGIMDPDHLENTAYFRPWPYRVYIEDNWASGQRQSSLVVQKEGAVLMRVPENDEGRAALEKVYPDWRLWLDHSN